MPDTVHLTINDIELDVPTGSLVAAALALAGVPSTRHSINGEPRAPLCGMGICYECRVTINGHSQRLSCQVLCEEGMRISTTSRTPVFQTGACRNPQGEL